MGISILSTSPRRHERPEARRQQGRRRAPLRGVVMDDRELRPKRPKRRRRRASASARSTLPKGVTVTVNGRQRSRSRARRASSRARSRRTSTSRSRAASSHVISTVAGRDGARFQGLARALIAGMVKGAPTATSETLELDGTGYRAELKGTTLNLALGFSHPIVFPLPEGHHGDDPGRLEGHASSSSRAPTRSSSARPPPRSAASVRRSRTAARAFATGREGPREGGQGRQRRRK